jgi:hypothetical protein
MTYPISEPWEWGVPKMFSAKVSTTSIMVLAEKVATGIPLSKREASRQLELGIRNRDFLDF